MAACGEIAKLAAEHQPALAQIARRQGGIVVRRKIEIIRNAEIEAIAFRQPETRIQQAALARIVERETQVRRIQHRHIADTDGRVVRLADIGFAIDIHRVGADFPLAVGWIAGRIGDPAIGLLLALDGRLHRLAVAALVEQLVLDVVEGGDVLGGLRVGLAGGQPHGRILVAHRPFGLIAIGLVVVGHLVGQQPLVGAFNLGIALECGDILQVRVDQIRLCVRRTGIAIGGVAGRCLARKRRHRIRSAAQDPGIGLRLLGLRRHRHRQAQRQDAQYARAQQTQAGPLRLQSMRLRQVRLQRARRLVHGDILDGNTASLP